jgi:ABC-2 type transport system ATP-binding protein
MVADAPAARPASVWRRAFRPLPVLVPPRMSIENSISLASPAAPSGPETPAVIRVEDLHKTFRIPTHRVDSLKERAVHPFAAREYRELHALDGISFEIRQGEFFGIVGRNGSGKSTLLKLLASIYRADAGRIQIAGRLAPFIELGVGFNQELTARENVLLNGVMMGLTPKEVRGRQDAVIDFAELHDFADLKLKNYSSGMLVRLAFSVMLQADADILLIDEVLAVGDASFQQKCADAFHDMKAAGKTIVLVTHDMAAAEQYCHRAMLLADGEVRYIGKPVDAGREYLKLNFEADAGGTGATVPEVEGEGARLLDIELLGAEGKGVTSLETREAIQVRARVELLQSCHAIQVGFVLVNEDELGILEFGELLTEEMFDGPIPLEQPITVTASLENRLASGRYYLHCGISGYGGIQVYVPRAISFVLFGTEQTRGLISPDVEYDVQLGERRR